MPKVVQKTVRLHRQQQAFRRSNALYRGFVGGRGAGKSWVGAYDLIRRAVPGATYVVGSPTYVLMEDTTLPTFLAIAKDLGVFRGLKLTPRPNVRLSRSVTVRFRSAEEPDKMRGPNLSGVWLDEASLMVREAFTIGIACLREEGRQGWMSATFTPKGMAHWTYQVFGKDQPSTEIFHSPTRANPFLPPEFAATLAKVYTDEEASQELEGHFLDTDDGWQVIPTAWVRAAMQRWKVPAPDTRLDALGADIARGGSNKTVLAPRYGHTVGKLFKHKGSATPDGRAACNLIVRATHGHPGCLVCVDVIGIGASAFDFSKEIGWLRVLPVNFGAKGELSDTTGTLKMANVRAYAYWSLRELLDPNRPEAERLTLPPDEELLEDLIAPHYEMTVSGIQLEKKEDIVERLGRSPDCGDAVACSVLLPGPALGAAWGRK